MDLRLHDNPSLCASIDAAQKSAGATGMCVLRIENPRLYLAYLRLVFVLAYPKTPLFW